MSSKTFKLTALGCRTNQYEVQAFRDQLLQLGLREAEKDEEADLCIVNTCTVTEGADRSSRHEIRHLARKNPGAKLIVTGCLAERNPALIEEIPEISLLISNQKKESLLDAIFPEEKLPEFAIKRFEAHTRAFVKIQDGCNSFCTYCIIPYVRGRSRSRKLEDIVHEVEGLVNAGYLEIVLTGINIGDFQDGDNTLADLVRVVDQIDGLKRLRLSSIDPDEVNDDLMDAIINGKNTCPSLHLVLQSGSNVILKRMNRKYNRQIFLDTVEKLQKAEPEFTFTTDVIIGFPGETENDFQETIDVMQNVQFAHVHMFPYSPRERTRAALFPNQVPQEIIKERKKRVLRLAEQHAYLLREKYVGKTKTILTEEGDSGHTENFLQVFVPSMQLKSNELIRVFLKENSPQGLIGCVL